MNIDTHFFTRCINTLDEIQKRLNNLDAEQESIEYDILRSASVKEFEIILEQAGKLLKKCLKPYFHSPKAVDKLFFKDIFRHAAQFDLMSTEQAERWLEYRDNRNNTAHDYGVQFADTTLKLLSQFIEDAKALEAVIREQKHD